MMKNRILYDREFKGMVESLLENGSIKSIEEARRVFKIGGSMDVTISNNTMYVTGVDTAVIWANCNCYFDLSIDVTRLQSGNYFVEVYRKFLLFPDTVFYIGTTSFPYGGSTLAFNSYPYQSNCYNITNAEVIEDHPKEFSLEKNFPNPFNPTTKIKFTVADAYYASLVMVRLVVYDFLGNEITTLVNEEKQPGVYEVEFNSRDLSSGVYFYKLTTGHGFVDTKKMLMLM